MRIQREKTAIVPGIMRIDTAAQAIDMQQIDNRRFMFHPGTGVLVLGRQYASTSIASSSHAQELADAGITKDYDRFVRGWVGTGGEYPYGVIHFAPSVDERNIRLFERAFDTLEMFARNGGLAPTVIRGFGDRWEQPFCAILPGLKEPEKKPSVRGQLKQRPKGREGRRNRNKETKQQER